MSTVNISNALRINSESYTSESAQQTREELAASTAGEASGSASGADRVTLSTKAVEMAQSMKAAKTDDSTAEEQQVEQQINRLKEQIEKLKEKIKEMQQSELPEDQKEQQTAQLQQQLMQYQTELAKLQQQSGGGTAGSIAAVGTDAKGFANSLT